MRVCPPLREFCFDYQGECFMQPICIFLTRFWDVFCSADVRLTGTRPDLWDRCKSPLCAQQADFGQAPLKVDIKLSPTLKT